MQEIGVAVIGFGLAGRVFHAPFVSAVPGLKLEAIVQRKGEEAAKAYRNDPDTDFHKLVGEMTGLDRDTAKTANFAKGYGSGVATFSLPFILTLLQQSFGWRGAVVGLAALYALL